MKRDNSMTRRFLVEAGVGEGMKAIEIGCGGGEVTQILAELVGPGGKVIALDRNREMLSSAQNLMNEHDISNVQFIQADLNDDSPELDSISESFDILAGRRVLMYLKQPASVLRNFAMRLKPGALIVFEETDPTMIPGRVDKLPAHEEASRWFTRMLESEGADIAMGFGLPKLLVDAGFCFEGIRAEAVIEGQGMQFPLSVLTRMMSQRLIAHEIATASEIESLAARIESEIQQSRTTVYVSAMNFCAWGRKPSELSNRQ